MIHHIDSPSTTSEITYNFKYFLSKGSSGNVHTNRSNNDTDNADSPRTSSSVTLMEIGA